jgi:heterodisulfide reductase subunit A-like polyferredoxin
MNGGDLMTEVVATNETILVVGGGISGMTAALEAAETGKNVVLVEKNPAIGGRTSHCVIRFAAWKSICAGSNPIRASVS